MCSCKRKQQHYMATTLVYSDSQLMYRRTGNSLHIINMYGGTNKVTYNKYSYFYSIT